MKVSQDSVLGQTLNKFELGESDKTKLKSISGIEYYRQHIHDDQALRLKKFVKDAAGHNHKVKNFIPLTDVAKPSMKGRVKMYMQKLTEEQNREKEKSRQTAQAGAQKSNSMLGHVDANLLSPQKEDPFSKSLRVKGGVKGESARNVFESNLKTMNEGQSNRRNQTIQQRSMNNRRTTVISANENHQSAAKTE